MAIFTFLASSLILFLPVLLNSCFLFSSTNAIQSPFRNFAAQNIALLDLFNRCLENQTQLLAPGGNSSNKLSRKPLSFPMTAEIIQRKKTLLKNIIYLLSQSMFNETNIDTLVTTTTAVPTATPTTMSTTIPTTMFTSTIQPTLESTTPRQMEFPPWWTSIPWWMTTTIPTTISIPQLTTIPIPTNTPTTPSNERFTFPTVTTETSTSS